MTTKLAIVAMGGMLAGAASASSAASDMPGPAGAEIKATAIRLLQPSNARRLEQLQSILRERGIAFELQPVRNPQPKRDPRAEGSNVVASVGSTSGESRIVIGAHFDAAALQGGKLSAGMVDNASSVAVLVHLAAAMKERPTKHRVDVVFFDMEELGLVGSRHYADSPQIDSVVAMINLDTLQGGSTVIYGPTADTESQDIDRHMRQVCVAAQLDCLAFPEYPPSDDRSFADVGVPNVSIAVVPQVESHQLWLLMNGGRASGLQHGFVPEVLRTIHTPADQPDKLEPDALATAHRAAMALLMKLDQELP